MSTPPSPSTPREANLLGALALAVGDHVTAALETAVANDSDAAAVVSLAGYLDGDPIESLRRPVGLSHSATVRLTDRLVAAGLVRRTAGTDRRAVAVELTAKGRRTARKVADLRNQALTEALARLDPRARAAMAGHIETVLATLSAGSADPQRTCRLCDIEACGHAEGHCPVTNAARGRARG